MKGIPAKLRRLVRARAQDRCEYCQLSQAGQKAAFHIDHIVPRADGGRTTSGNLALACVSCSLRKEARRSAVDPATGRILALFHPRRQLWPEHFRWDGAVLIALTATGRATIAGRKLNRPLILAIREEEMSDDDIRFYNELRVPQDARGFRELLPGPGEGRW